MTNMYGRQIVLPLVNKSGGAVVAGDVVILDSANDTAFTTTTTGRAEVAVGIAQEAIASNATGRVLIGGYAALVNVPASVTRGHYVETHTVAKQATGSSTRRSGSFGVFLTGGTTPTAMIGGLPDQTVTGGSAVFKGVKAYRTTTQAISSSTMTAVSFASEEFDTDAFHDNVTNPTRLTIPTTGYYALTGYVYWASAPTSPIIRFKKNGTTVIRSQVIGAAGDTGQVVTTVASLSAADYVELECITFGAGLNIGDATNIEQQPFASAIFLGT